MTTIELPIWLLITILTLFVIGLLGILVRTVSKRIQKSLASCDPKTARDGAVCNNGLDSAFHQDLYALQIDAVFNALSALIETERIKLKSLLCPTVPYLAEKPFIDSHAPSSLADSDAPVRQSLDLQVAERAAMGQAIDDIAAELNISHREVELAISMNSERLSGRRNRLEAVA